MTMAARAGHESGPCPSTQHRHDQPQTGGRCAFYSPGRPGDICGRAPVALYVNPFAKVLNTYRCATHDRPIVHEAAAAQGFRRVPLESKADRIAAVDRAVARG